MTAALKNVQAIIWDLDGTLYRFTELFKIACNHAAAATALKFQPELVYEEAFELCVKSEAAYGFSLHWFEHGHTGSYEEMHFVYHDNIDEKVIEANDAMAQGLRSLDIPSVILTNAARSWVKRILVQLQMADIFGDEDVFCLEDAGFIGKGRSTTGFMIAIEKIGLKPENILVVEDLPRNLIKAKEAGLMTALVHHGQIPDDRQDIDFLFADTLECIAAVKDARKN